MGSLLCKSSACVVVHAVDIALRNEMVAVEVDGTAHWTQVLTSAAGCLRGQPGASRTALPWRTATLPVT